MDDLDALEQLSSSMDESLVGLGSQVENLRSEHKKIIQEETDLLQKIKVADELVHHIQRLESDLEQAKSTSEVTQLVKEVRMFGGLFGAIHAETVDVRQKLEAELSDEANIEDVEDQMSQHVNKLESINTQYSNRAGGREGAMNSIQEWENSFEGVSADQLRSKLPI